MSLFGIFCVLFGVAVAAYGVNVLLPREISCRGKPLPYWIDELCSSSTERKARARDAFRAMGPRALEPLVQMIEARDTVLDSWLVQVAQKNPILARQFVSADARHAKAVVAFTALGSVAEPAIPELSRLMDDPDTCLEAIWALGGIGRKAAAPLTMALANPESQMRERAVCFLGTMGADAVDAVPALAERVHDEDEEVRLSAVMALGSLGRVCGKKAMTVKALAGCFRDTSDNVRRMAALALRGYGADARQAVPGLIGLLGDRCAGVRGAAAYTLGKCAPDSGPVVSALIRSLDDRDETVRRAASRALVSMGIAVTDADGGFVEIARTAR